MKQTAFCFILFLSLFSTALHGNSVNAYEQELLKEINKEQEITSRFSAYLNLIRYYQLNDYGRALSYCDTAYNLAQNEDNIDYQYLVTLARIRTLLSQGQPADAYAQLSIIERNIHKTSSNKVLGSYYLIKNFIADSEGNAIKAMNYSIKALNYFKMAQDTTGIAKTYNNIGIAFTSFRNVQKAIEYYYLAIDLAEKINYQELLTSAYNNLGILYNDLGQNDKALDYYMKALDYAKKTNDIYTITIELNNIGLLYLDLKNYKEALFNFYEGIEIAKELNLIGDEALLCNNIGELYRELNKYDSADYYYHRSINLYKQIGDTLSIATSTYSLAELYTNKKEYHKAIKTFKRVNYLLKNSGVSSFNEEVYVELSKLYILINDYKTAHNYLNIAKNIGDSIGSLSIDDELAFAELQLEYRNKVEDFEEGLHSFEVEHNQKLKEERNSKFVVIIIAVLLLIVLILLFVRSKRSHVINELLVQKNKDIEEQKALMEIANIELREQYAFTETLLNTIPNPVFYTTKKGNIIGCNNAFAESVGLPEEELIGVSVRDIKKVANFNCDLIDQFTASEIKTIKEGTMVDAGGSSHDIICYKQGIVEKDGLVIGVLGVIIDVTEIRKVEKSLSQSQKQLKDAISAKDKFFSIMAHDLKNPFNAVLGLTHLISTKFENFNEEEIKNYAGLINKSARQIFNLLENILEWSRAQSGAIIKTPVVFDINEPLRECVGLIDNNLEQKGIKLEYAYSNEIKVNVDKNMILTVFRNILMNAVKYTPDNGLIRIVTQSDNERVKVSIIDNGVGISEENLEKLFKIDQPITTPGLDNEKGTGLGLIICKEFIAQNNGFLTVESKENMGSTFIIDLPLHKL